jgi:uncharacterized protein (TIGR02118 family)
MIRVSVLYPKNENSRFDMDYYCQKHMAMVRERLGSACKGISADWGLGGGQPGSAPPYIAAGHLLFDSVEAFQTAFGPHAQALLGDIPNFTNTQPTIQISEIKL